MKNLIGRRRNRRWRSKGLNGGRSCWFKLGAKICNFVVEELEEGEDQVLGYNGVGENRRRFTR
jgi:hypothetical protein